jgi:hypothetical protein
MALVWIAQNIAYALVSVAVIPAATKAGVQICWKAARNVADVAHKEVSNAIYGDVCLKLKKSRMYIINKGGKIVDIDMHKKYIIKGGELYVLGCGDDSELYNELNKELLQLQKLQQQDWTIL